MRRLAYAVAAVLAVAPLAAIAPASATVQHPAVAQTKCSGGWPVVTIRNANAVSGKYVGSWHVAKGVIEDSHSRTAAKFCEVTVRSGREYAFREQGTRDCAAFQLTGYIVVMKDCDRSSTNQDWYLPHHGAGMYPNSDRKQCLDGSGGDEDIFMNTCGQAPNNQDWTISKV
jgi:hypothetical protein